MTATSVTNISSLKCTKTVRENAISNEESTTTKLVCVKRKIKTREALFPQSKISVAAGYTPAVAFMLKIAQSFVISYCDGLRVLYSGKVIQEM